MISVFSSLSYSLVAGAPIYYYALWLLKVTQN